MESPTYSKKSFLSVARTAKLPSCSSLSVILALTGFLGWYFQKLGTPCSALRWARVTDLSSVLRKGDPVKHSILAFLVFL